MFVLPNIRFLLFQRQQTSPCLPPSPTYGDIQVLITRDSPFGLWLELCCDILLCTQIPPPPNLSFINIFGVCQDRDQGPGSQYTSLAPLDFQPPEVSGPELSDAHMTWLNFVRRPDDGATRKRCRGRNKKSVSP